jgi:hypothetical protein
VTGLRDAAQIDRVLVLIADDEADEVDVEAPALRQVLHAKHGMACTRDVERRIVDRLRNAHGLLRG